MLLLTGCSAADPAGPGASSAPSGTASTPGATPGTADPSAGAPASPAAGPSATAQPSGSAADLAATRVVLTRTGGFAGRGDTLTVEPNGGWTSVERDGSRRTGQVDPTDLNRLWDLLAAPGLATEPATPPTGPVDCADAFTYQLTVGPRVTAYVDCPDAAGRAAATAAVVELLGEVTGW
ncbi:hypothetical protein K7640_14905 [Micromonospora sp. PLK6-60]|uniref:hypothetical protein n=1 Tax=Micromonospora sp. PLK6-60 TaxID=2873383 RepID=UPI001CA71E31|nr:hypothetical protein [Micromonospora sp. PLK6-60]MBY8873123.1 hypothetical protein [Micromonospora sp. PLK6-60]